MSETEIAQSAKDLFAQFKLKMLWKQTEGRIVARTFLSSSLAQKVADCTDEMLYGSGYIAYSEGRTVFIVRDHP